MLPFKISNLFSRLNCNFGCVNKLYKGRSVEVSGKNNCIVLSRSKSSEIDWRDAVSEAERIVGYPTSFLNLRWLFNDEIANTAIHLRKLVSTYQRNIKITSSASRTSSKRVLS